MWGRGCCFVCATVGWFTLGFYKSVQVAAGQASSGEQHGGVKNTRDIASKSGNGLKPALFPPASTIHAWHNLFSSFCQDFLSVLYLKENWECGGLVWRHSVGGGVVWFFGGEGDFFQLVGPFFFSRLFEQLLAAHVAYFYGCNYTLTRIVLVQLGEGAPGLGLWGVQVGSRVSGPLVA